MDHLFLSIVKMTDYNTTTRKVDADGQTNAPPADRIATAKQTFLMTLDLSNKISKRWLRFGSDSFFLLSVVSSIVVSVGGSFLITSLLVDLSSGVGLLVYFFLALVLMAVASWLSLRDNGFLFIIRLLNANQTLEFLIDSTHIISFSAWGRFVSRNDGHTKFGVETEGFFHSVYLERVEDGNLRRCWVFRLPRQISEGVFTKGGFGQNS